MVDGTRLLPQGWLEESTTPFAVPGQMGGSYGSAFWLNRRPDGSLVAPSLPADAFWMQGHDGQYLYVVPSERLVVLRMGFDPGRSSLGTHELVADVIEAIHTPG